MSRAARPHGLPRRHRFSTRGSFGPALQGRRKLRGRLSTLHVLARNAPCSRFGISLTRKLVPRSVDRTRLKRVAREAFRRHAVKLASCDCVVTLRVRYTPADEGEFLRELHEHLSKAVGMAR